MNTTEVEHHSRENHGDQPDYREREGRSETGKKGGRGCRRLPYGSSGTVPL